MRAACWNLPDSLPQFPSLDRDLKADVVVIGGGITGLTTAYLLKRAGRRVVIVERGRFAGVDTGSTTAHLTMVTDLQMTDLIKNFGEDHARAVWDAGLAAISQIAHIVDDEGIDCHFEWVRGYLHEPVVMRDEDREKQHQQLQKEAEAAWNLGFDARFFERAPLVERAAVEYDHQARFHPGLYLKKLVAAIDGDGCQLFENTTAEEVESDPLVVKAGGHRISTDYVVVATHNPIVGKSSFLGATLLQTKLALYNSYVVAARTTKGRIPDALYWDTADPYRYLRIDPGDNGHDQLIYGGEDHKTGQVSDGASRFAALESSLVRLVPDITLTHRWLGQVIETTDGLPYIGESSSHQFIATGVGGNGITFGTLSAMMAHDCVAGVKNPWADLFDPGRKKISGLWDYLKENKDYPYYLVRDRFAGADARSLRAVPRATGKILELDGQMVAAYRHSDGEVTLLSSICTHLGCRVDWNSADHTWDCPCHGSRFAPTGDVLAGPAEKPLPEAKITAKTAK